MNEWPTTTQRFNGLSAVFLEYRKLHGEKDTLAFMAGVFARRLQAVYDSLGFRKGDLENFCRVVGGNDELLGLRVELLPGEKGITYRFLTDPFPLLKGKVDSARFDRTYMEFKIRYLLGRGWRYRTGRHLWRGDPCTEHVIEKQKNPARQS